MKLGIMGQAGEPSPDDAGVVTVANRPHSPSLPAAATVPETELDAEVAHAEFPASDAPQFRLVVVRGEIPGVTFPLLPGRNTLGRSGERPVDIELSAQEHAERTWTSRQHACVRVEAGKLFVDDLMSLNGTFLNGARVHPGQPRSAQPGDVVQVGTIQLRIEQTA